MITGIGVVLKSSLGREIVRTVPESLRVDLDYIPLYQYNRLLEEEKNDPDILLVLESVHGLEEKAHVFDAEISNNPCSYDLIIYLLPPKNHLWLWLNRAWSWFACGTIDLNRGNHRKYSLANIPLILGDLNRQFWNRRKWVKKDLKKIQSLRNNGAHIAIAQGLNEGLKVFQNWYNGKEY